MTSDSKKKWERNRKKKEKKILECFVALYHEKGYDDISIRDIAKASNVSIGTIYRYYKDGKLSILTKFLDDTSKTVLDESALGSLPNGDLKTLVRFYITNHLKSHRANLKIHKALYQAALSDNVTHTNAQELLDPMLERSLKIVKKVLPLKIAPEEEFNRAIRLIFNLIESVIHRHLYILPIVETDQELVDFLSNIALGILEEYQ